ncbi:F0F1 ATP synthase subunit B [Ruegeria pomeroyi]|jgi:F-type H+-transporting ATPase subunit b|uniref:ATP synthase subunit b n=2 Tax=Ruegeria pomeroyi TaxID=89184 RepID=ATPF_RUEPO|nr:F0F1 ATP synthase subunit B [Ruegeria pomeroyi]Q5LNH2.1 RecName: Full=ATP synthase subunit b; AltName: Full=ATP synthase F(0) sector subunit b; AltName: Full=ATPase subunit I; AltName: Full=F-type ATPase subunit b; Short=F-ATPase subunit b [Ruegeria pomeroyi DSS-3]HCE70310.1 ATP synthase subunit B [Ruegeria sp.]AAV96468.1 ATP synthase F0, B subunit [Ruegeria pomeroyi DSS-3]NVK95701.1 F0F1 ATP synthase subunit B [Ruegeria pomeroyi]NVL03770.1 F0F1 ATP synthase subunit B [Ruegeria pomeroyi]QW
MRNILAPVLSLVLIAGVASPALAASGPFFSLKNTDFVVTIAFLVFIAVLFYFKVPSMIGGALDKRAEGIQSDLDEARKLREEAQSLLASFERKQKEMQGQADAIVAAAKEEAQRSAEQAKVDLEASIARRLAAAQDQIASAEAAAVKDVRDRAIAIAVAAAGDVIASSMTAAEANKLIDAGIADAGAKLH